MAMLMLASLIFSHLDTSRAPLYPEVMNTTAERIKSLNLQAHPEGGWYVETYRSSDTVTWEGGERSACTGILFLLEQGQVSTFHRIDADELWHYHEGSPVRVHMLSESGYESFVVGPLSTPGARLQAWVPKGVWFGAEPLGDGPHSLVGCTVAPGFEFSRFELARREALMAEFPAHEELITRLTRG